jgi:hypothetical protein
VGDGRPNRAVSVAGLVPWAGPPADNSISAPTVKTTPAAIPSPRPSWDPWVIKIFFTGEVTRSVGGSSGALSTIGLSGKISCCQSGQYD